MKARHAVASFAGAALMLLNALGVHAMPNIVDPPLGPEETNLLAAIAPGTHIRGGQALGAHCLVTDVQLEDVKGAYLNRSVNGPYFVGNHVIEIDIECAPSVSGVAYAGDNDPQAGETLTKWFIDGKEWVPDPGSDVWHAMPLTNVRSIIIVPGDSLFGTIGEVQSGTGLPETGEPGAGGKLYLPVVAS